MLKTKQNNPAKSVKLLYTQVFFREGTENFLGFFREDLQIFWYYIQTEAISLVIFFSRISLPDKRRCHSASSTPPIVAISAAASVPIEPLPPQPSRSSGGTSPDRARGRRGRGVRPLRRLRKVLRKSPATRGPKPAVSPFFFFF